MRFHEEAKREAYDAIVVGSGLGGLTTAALLANAGKRVLVAERHDRTGGYAHSFRRRRYLFDSAVHLVGGCAPSAYAGGGVVHRVLEATGVRDRCDFVPVDPVYTAFFPGLELRAPSGLEEFIQAHLEHFPGEEKGLRQLVQDCLGIGEETAAADRLDSPFDVLDRPGRFPSLLRFRRATLQAVMDERLTDPECMAAFASLWPYVGLPPSRVSFLYFATMLMSYVAEGAYACRGTFQRLADALTFAVERAGGEVLLRSPVRRIRVANGRVAGIVLENGQRVSAPQVISNADARQTMEELVGASHFPRRYRRTLQRLRPSTSAFVLYLATDVDLSDLGHESFFYNGIDHDAAYRGVESGQPDWFSLTVPTLADPALAPEGEHLLTVTTLVDPDAVRSWTASKQPFADALLERVCRRVPSLTGRVQFCEAGSPRTLERYTRNEGGALYGFALSPAQVGPSRPAHATPVPGLFLAGHWTQPGGGVVGVVRSGVQAARQCLGLHSDAELWNSVSKR